MAQPKLKRPSLSQVLKLVDRLPTNEQEQLRRNLSNRTSGQRFQQLCDEIEATRIAKGLSRLTDEEIIIEVKAARQKIQGKRDRSSR